MPIPKGWKRKRLVKNWRAYCKRGSIRTVTSGKARVLICRPKKGGKTRAISIDTPKRFGDVPADLARAGKCGEATRALSKLTGIRRDYEAEIVSELCSMGPRGASFSEAAWKKEMREHPWATKAQAKRIARDHSRRK